MKNLLRHEYTLCATVAGILLCCASVVADESPRSSPKSHNAQPPIRGQWVQGVELFDQVMLTYLNKIGCTAATLAISNRGHLIVSRGYGWCDKERTIRTEPNTIIGLASCEKSFTAAAIKQLAAHRKLNLDAPLFDILQIQPRGRVTDRRVYQITVRHLIDHKAGWGEDPAGKAILLARKSGLKEPFSPEDLLGFIMTQSLNNAPGEKEAYCNFGYDTLREIIVKLTGHSCIDYFQHELFRPLVLTEIRSPHDPQGEHEPPAVWNLAEGGPVGASAPAMCFFMHHYWFAGEPRDNGNPLWIRYGSLPGSTALMIWRPDGIDIAAIFNGRHKDVSHDEISRQLQQVVESQLRKK
jgi:CubicO group peptidase (beta-lactamase class C family)